MYYTVFGDESLNNTTYEDKMLITDDYLTSDLGIKLRFQKDFLNLNTLENIKFTRIRDSNLCDYTHSKY